MFAPLATWMAATMALTPAPLSPTPDSVGFTGHLAFRWTELYEDRARLAGGGIGVRLGEGTRVEVVGFGTARPSRYGTLDFHVAYGGVQVEREVWRSGRLSVAAALLAGAGSFWVEDRVADAEQRTGIWVVEPDVSLGVHVGEHLRIAADGSYRWVRGIEGDIPNRSDGDATSFAVGLRLVLR